MTAASGAASPPSRYWRRTHRSSIANTSAVRPEPSNSPVCMPRMVVTGGCRRGGIVASCHSGPTGPAVAPVFADLLDRGDLWWPRTAGAPLLPVGVLAVGGPVVSCFAAFGPFGAQVPGTV